MDKTNDILLFIEQLLKENGIPVHYLDTPSDLTAKADFGLRSGILKYENTIQDILGFFENLEDRKIYFISDIFECNYIAFYLPDSKNIFLTGPILWEPMNQEHFQKLFHRLDIPKDFEIPLFNYYKKITIIGAHSFYENMFLQLMKTFYGNEYSVEYILYENIGNPNLDAYGILRNPIQTFSYIDILSRRYEIENEIIQTVLSGNESLALETAKKSVQILSGLPQRLTNPVRDFKNYLIAVNTVLRKSIELKGVHPIYIDETSSQFVIEIEQCINQEQIFNLFEKIILTYCKIAHKTSHLNHSQFVDTVLTYINADLSGDLSLKSLAAHLNVNASYLSALFSDEMGISLTNYVTQQRIAYAKELLQYTNRTIKSVALQCGFTDIHYFSRQFKKIAGLSPKLYRESHSFSDEKLLTKLNEPKEKNRGK